MATNAKQKRQAALDALIECDTFTQAAQQAGISRKTLYNYLSTDADFATQYARMTEQQTMEAVEVAVQKKAAALDTIEAIMTDERQSGAIRLKAAAMLAELSDSEIRRGREIATRNAQETNHPFTQPLW